MTACTVEVTIDGQKVEVPEGATLLDACRQAGKDVPTFCWAENFTPVDVCRICVVELEGARTLVPACSRKAEAGQVVQTDSPRVRHSRKRVLELLGSSMDMSLCRDYQALVMRYGAKPERFGEKARPAPAGRATRATRATTTRSTVRMRRRWASR
jgi:predicted molibdopterin-dependent oxidoreductase YjgC